MMYLRFWKFSLYVQVRPAMRKSTRYSVKVK